MKIVVTGGAGFIGSHIVKSLLEKGHKVVIYDNFSTGNLENLSGYEKDIEIIKADILNTDSLNKAFAGADAVSHHAAQLEILRGTDDPYFDLNVNTTGTLNVLYAAKQAGVGKVINASSACIYGQVDKAVGEVHDFRPNWTYGVSKLAAEKYCDVYNDYQNLPVVSLRYAITYGEFEWFRRVLTIFCKRVISDLPPVVFGDGSQIRDFIYVGDAVRLHNLCLEKDDANSKSFNVGTGIPTTVKQLAESTILASGKNLEVQFENTPEGEFSKLVPDKKRNTAELKVMLLDISKAKKELKWEPQTSLTEGLKKEIEWASRNMHRWEKVFYSKV
jgi:UDP-glucose 4-epimerase